MYRKKVFLLRFGKIYNSYTFTADGEPGIADTMTTD